MLYPRVASTPHILTLPLLPLPRLSNIYSYPSQKGRGDNKGISFSNDTGPSEGKEEYALPYLHRRRYPKTQA